MGPNPASLCPYKRRKIGHTKQSQGCKWTENYKKVAICKPQKEASGKKINLVDTLLSDF